MQLGLVPLEVAGLLLSFFFSILSFLMWQSSISGAVYSHTRCSAVQLQVILKHGLKAAFLGGACIWCAVLGGEQRASWPCHCCPPTGTRTQLGAVHRHRGPLLPSPVLLLQLWA